MHMSEYFDFTSRTAVVTGGASGLGRAIAEGLCMHGATIAILDVGKEAAESTRDEFRQRYGDRVVSYICDVSNEKVVAETFRLIREEIGTPQILVNSAGINYQRKAEELSLEDWNKIVGVNLTGTFLTCSHFGRYALEEGCGSIINIASMSGIIVNRHRNISAYSAAKGGVIMYTKAIASEWSQRGIRANAVAPGYFHTPFNEKWIQNNEVYRQALDNTPINRLGNPDEIVPLTLFLASEASSYITGAVYSIDGGYTIW